MGKDEPRMSKFPAPNVSAPPIWASRLARVVGASLLALAATVSLPAQAQKIKVHNTYGSPLDTLENTHLTTEVPKPKDFVRATSPDAKVLDYTRTTGFGTPADPERPKPRSAKDVEALQAELENAGVRNERRAKGLLPHKARTASHKDAAANASTR